MKLNAINALCVQMGLMGILFYSANVQCTGFPNILLFNILGGLHIVCLLSHIYFHMQNKGHISNKISLDINIKNFHIVKQMVPSKRRYIKGWQ